MTEDSLKGRLLVATPVLYDPNFDHSVVLVLEHGDEGAVGVVLNRPSAVAGSEPLEQWAALLAEPAVVFVGGPVSPGAAVGLGAARSGAAAGDDVWTPVIGPVGTVDLSREPGELAAGVERVRVFSGYAGWGAGQLETEIAAGAWVVAEAHPDDALGPDPGSLWRTVLRRQPGPTAWLSTNLGDPAHN